MLDTGLTHEGRYHKSWITADQSFSSDSSSDISTSSSETDTSIEDGSTSYSSSSTISTETISSDSSSSTFSGDIEHNSSRRSKGDIICGVVLFVIGLAMISTFTIMIGLTISKGYKKDYCNSLVENDKCILYGTSPHGVKFKCQVNEACSVGLHECWFEGENPCPTLIEPSISSLLPLYIILFFVGAVLWVILFVVC